MSISAERCVVRSEADSMGDHDARCAPNLCGVADDEPHQHRTPGGRRLDGPAVRTVPPSTPPPAGAVDELTGLGWWRAARLLLPRKDTLRALLHVGPYLGVAVVGSLFGDPRAYAVAVVLPIVFATLVVSANEGVPVTAESQPALHALVDTVAARLGVRRPRRVRLVANAAVVAATSFGRRELHIGHPLLACLSEAELAALIGAELSLLGQRRPRLAVWLRGEWLAVGGRIYREEAAASRRDRARWRALGPFGGAVVAAADRAAAAAGGGYEVAARAAVLRDIASTEHGWYVDDCRPPRGYAILDLDDGWVRRLDHGMRAWWDGTFTEDLILFHPALAATFADLALPTHLGRADDAVRLSPLPDRERRGLVRDMLDLYAVQRVRWITFEQAPAQWWVNRANQDAIDAWQTAHSWADDRELPDEAAALEMLERSVGRLDPAAPLSAEQTYDLMRFALPLVELALLERGWRLEHPAVRAVLIGPDGTRVDHSAIAAAVADPAILRGWLTPDGAVTR
jgi:hypothetical protein